jgi:glyoxylase-like metal-dependent hydrolase (beta-lactamase superfamily II)
VLIAGFPAGAWGTNCYVVATGQGAECIVVDPGMDATDGVEQVVRENGLKPVAVLLTHGHIDHMFSVLPVCGTYDATAWIHPDDRHLLADPMAAISGESAAMLRAQLGMHDLPTFAEPADVRDAVDGATIEVDGLTFTVDHVPGHTPGTVVYRIPWDGPEEVSELMFSGDFLFQGSIGRTDLTGGSHPQMEQSLRDRVLPLADDIVVLPGHGPQTSIGRERVTNPFLLELSA